MLDIVFITLGTPVEDPGVVHVTTGICEAAAMSTAVVTIWSHMAAHNVAHDCVQCLHSLADVPLCSLVDLV